MSMKILINVESLLEKTNAHAFILNKTMVYFCYNVTEELENVLQRR